jgi:GH24 family phage-related lysozyme (muramidase)
VTKSDGSIIKVTKDTVVTREDAERDLARRSKEAAIIASGQVGADVWTSLPGNVSGPLTSVAYNYGSLPKRILAAVKSGDKEAIATAVEGLAGDNGGINSRRRLREASIIRGQGTPPTAAPVQTARDEPRPATPDVIVPTQSSTAAAPQGQVDSGLAEAVAAGSVITADIPEANVPPETLALLTRHGYDPSTTPVFGSEEEAEAAFNSGILTVGQPVIIGGVVSIVQEE